jgi:DNA-binding transcriptional regulator GbsR (MarR family)
MPSVKESVTEQLGNIGPSVREKVVTLLVDAEVEKRTNAVVAVVRKLDEANAALKKINRADNETFNEDGSVATATFTKTRLDDIKKNKEIIAKLEKALDEAFEKSDFQKVFDLSK